MAASATERMVAEISKIDSKHLVVVVMLVVVAWELLKRLFVWLGGGATLPLPLLLASPAEFQDLQVPPEPHVEIALHPPQGLHHSNPSEPWPYESDNTTGSYMFFHPATGPNTKEGPDGFDYAEYFRGKSRMWEMRVHMNFKNVPRDDEELFFGIELDQYVAMSQATKQAQKVVVAGIKQAIGGLYHSAGDDPGRTKEEVELPVCVLPLWAYDQFIVTPEGEEPPRLWDENFGTFGHKRYKRVAEYADEIRELQRNLSVGPTYTFSFWGNSRFLDVLNWMVIGLPIVTPISFNKFAGRPPVHVVLYSLKKHPNNPRHLRSRKTYYFRGAVWSSQHRPERRYMELLTGQLSKEEEKVEEGTPSKPKSMRRRFNGFVQRNFTDACTGRTRESQ
mmetsp:Transcript_8423/g.25455  ORF Transcript_8423/g.25455 Transcript_8423/m.25455 type:complete len:391 (+) Transcript_8423:65-1237(+)